MFGGFKCGYVRALGIEGGMAHKPAVLSTSTYSRNVNVPTLLFTCWRWMYRCPFVNFLCLADCYNFAEP
jgi:hypothetical protein